VEYLGEEQDDDEQDGVEGLRLGQGLALDDVGEFAEEEVLVGLCFEGNEDESAQVVEGIGAVIHHVVDLLVVQELVLEHTLLFHFALDLLLVAALLLLVLLIFLG
jgi:hypothetical protein